MEIIKNIIKWKCDCGKVYNEEVTTCEGDPIVLCCDKCNEEFWL